MTGYGQRVIGIVTVIDIGDTKLDFEYCCRKGHVIVCTQVVSPEQSGRFEWSGRRAAVTLGEVVNGLSPVNG